MASLNPRRQYANKLPLQFDVEYQYRWVAPSTTEHEDIAMIGNQSLAILCMAHSWYDECGYKVGIFIRSLLSDVFCVKI